MRTARSFNSDGYLLYPVRFFSMIPSSLPSGREDGIPRPIHLADRARLLGGYVRDLEYCDWGTRVEWIVANRALARACGVQSFHGRL